MEDFTMLKLLTKNVESKDFMTSEYLLSVKSNGNCNNSDLYEVTTNKYIYQATIPYTTKYDTNYGYIHQYKTNIMDICDKYNIDCKYYCTNPIDKNILPFNDSYKSEVGKYLPLSSYSHIY
jgi:hypothetical protein